MAIAHAEHRQVSDRLAAFLRTDPAAPEYEGAWQAFVTTLDAHAEKEERDLLPPPVAMSEPGGPRRPDAHRMDELRAAHLKQLRVKVRAAVLRALCCTSWRSGGLVLVLGRLGSIAALLLVHSVRRTRCTRLDTQDPRPAATGTTCTVATVRDMPSARGLLKTSLIVGRSSLPEYGA